MRVDSVYAAEKTGASPQGRKASLSWSTNGNTPALGIIELEHGAAARRHQVGPHAVDRALTVVHAVEDRTDGEASPPRRLMGTDGVSRMAGISGWLLQPGFP
jgi:hypothetical protein